MENEDHLGRKSVALFKSEPSEKSNDHYIELLTRNDIKADIIPTLAFNFINKDILQKELQNADDFSGIIFTSPRAVEAVQRIFTVAKDLDISDWMKKKNFSVGESTSSSAKTLLNMDTLGDDSGNSEQLCQLIISNMDKCCQPLLFPCSNQRKDTIPDLSKKGIAIKEVTCYETTCNLNMKQTWESFLLHQGIPGILVFFSPSAVKYSNELLRQTYPNFQEFKCVAVGPSTAKALSELVAPHTVYVAEKPNPTSVFNAVKNCMEEEKKIDSLCISKKII